MHLLLHGHLETAHPHRKRGLLNYDMGFTHCVLHRLQMSAYRHSWNWWHVSQCESSSRPSIAYLVPTLIWKTSQRARTHTQYSAERTRIWRVLYFPHIYAPRYAYTHQVSATLCTYIHMYICISLSHQSHKRCYCSVPRPASGARSPCTRSRDLVLVLVIGIVGQK